MEYLNIMSLKRMIFGGGESKNDEFKKISVFEKRVWKNCVWILELTESSLLKSL